MKACERYYFIKFSAEPWFKKNSCQSYLAYMIVFVFHISFLLDVII